MARAAAALAATGTNPTVDTVRAALGGTGSKSTIAPMLKQWKAEHEAQAVAASTGLPADLLEAVKAVHQRLEAAAQVQVEQLADQLAQARQQFEHFQEKAAEQRQQERQAAEARITAMERELGTTRGHLQEHRDALAILRTEKAHLVNKAAELGEAGKAQARQLRDATEALAAAREAISARQMELEMAEQRLGAVASDNARLDTRNGELLKEIAVLRAWKEAGFGPVKTPAGGKKK